MLVRERETHSRHDKGKVIFCPGLHQLIFSDVNGIAQVCNERQNFACGEKLFQRLAVKLCLGGKKMLFDPEDTGVCDFPLYAD